MIKSMTGFGKADLHIGDKTVTAEIRSLNSKQLDLSVKLPAAYRRCEYAVRQTVAQTLLRGKIDVTIAIEQSAAAEAASVNGVLFREYLRQMNETLAAAGIETSYDAIVPVIMRMPDVVTSNTQTISDDELKAVTDLVARAAATIDEFRRREGEALIADMLHRVEKIEALLSEVEPFEKARTETIRNRIREHFAQLSLEADPNRLEAEMIFYIEKLDITEEKVRLRNHCRYFREVAAQEDAAGRKLGFIAQEMGREINTLGSKSNDAQMQRLVVQMKDELEKIKEQVLNLL